MLHVDGAGATVGTARARAVELQQENGFRKTSQCRLKPFEALCEGFSAFFDVSKMVFNDFHFVFTGFSRVFRATEEHVEARGALGAHGAARLGAAHAAAADDEADEAHGHHELHPQRGAGSLRFEHL